MLCTSEFEGFLRNNQTTPLPGEGSAATASARRARDHLKRTPLAPLAPHGRRDDSFTRVPRRGRAACSLEAAVSAPHPPPPTQTVPPPPSAAVYSAPGPFCRQRLVPSAAGAAAAWRRFFRGREQSPATAGGRNRRRGRAGPDPRRRLPRDILTTSSPPSASSQKTSRTQNGSCLYIKSLGGRGGGGR